MGEAPAFQIYASDFYMDTLGWSIEEIGIYIRLLLSEWVNGSLPSDTERLNRVAMAPPSTFEACWPTIAPKFVDDGKGGLINLRLERTRAEQEEYRLHQSESGKRGAISRWKKNSNPNGDPNDNPNGRENGDHYDRKMALQPSSKEVVIKDITTSRQSPSCPHQEIIDIYHKECPTMRRVVVWNDSRQAFLRARWNEDPERQTLEWWTTFLKRCNASDFLSGRSEPTPGRRQFVADLEWLVRPTNFVKVIEGRYDNTKPTGGEGGRRSLVL